VIRNYIGNKVDFADLTSINLKGTIIVLGNVGKGGELKKELGSKIVVATTYILYKWLVT
jgi:hypothetical protein